MTEPSLEDISRILIVGLGSIGSRHLRIARELFPDAQIWVLRHEYSAITPQFATGTFFSLEAAIKFEPQITVVANPSTFHIEVATKLARTGSHLLIEKPISATLVGVSQLIRFCREQKIILRTAYNLRFSPSLQFFRQKLDEKMIGEVYSIRVEAGNYLPSWRPEADYKISVTARKELGGGVLLELSHELDYLRWIFGEVEWVRATLSRHSSLEIDVEDSAYLTLGFVVPHVEVERSLIATVNLDFIRHDPTRLCTAIGEKASIRWDGITGEVTILRKGERDWQQLFAHTPIRDETYVAEWRELISCIAADDENSSVHEDGLHVLNIIESARLSAVTGAQVLVADMNMEIR